MWIAIIGAGLAGVSCGDQLRRAGHAVVLFEKSRGVGGRMATRRVSTAGREIGLDHGAQYMTGRDPDFLAMLERWEAAGVVARWPDAGQDAWVGVPGMTAPVRLLAEELVVRHETRVSALNRDRNGWRVHNGNDTMTEPFDAAIVALPAEQAAAMLTPIAPDWATLAADTPSDPCWTALAMFDGAVPVAANMVAKRAPIVWAARNSAKPGRGGPESWVIQADPNWSRAHLEDAADAVAPALLRAFAEVTGAVLPPTTYLSAHRWRYARSGRAERTALWNPDTRLGVCGDWLQGPRVEGAFISGRALAARILEEG